MKVEFELNEHRVLVAAASGFLGLFALHAAYPGLFDYWPKTSSELADWVAALGTVGAIVGAVWTTRHQLHVNQKKSEYKELQRDLDMASVAMQSAYAVHNLVNRTVKTLGDPSSNSALLLTLPARLQHALETVDLILGRELDAVIFQRLAMSRLAIGLAQRALAEDKSGGLKSHKLIGLDLAGARRRAIKAKWQIRTHYRSLKKQYRTWDK